MPVQRPNVAVSARRSILPDGFLFGGVATLAITIVEVQRPFALYCQIESDQCTGCIRAEQIFEARTSVRSARFCQCHSANPRNTTSARSSRITSASVMRPRRCERCPAASWFDPRRGGRFHQVPGQWRQDRVRGQRAERDRSGRVEAIVLDDHDRFGLSGMGTPNRGNVDVSPPHSADSGSLEPPQSDRSTVTVPATLAPGRCGVAHRTPSTTVPIPIPLSVTVPARCHAPI